ncbi:MAG: glycosyl hydrolase [Clostridium neonatale]
MKHMKKKLLSLLLIFVMGISMSISYIPVYAADYVEWKNNAIIYPQSGQLVAAGPIYLQWHKLDDAIKYNVYIDDNFQGYVDATNDDVIEYEIYSTSVASHKLKIVAELVDGKNVTSNIRTFYVSKKGMGSGMIDKVQESGLSWYYHWATDPIDGADPKMQFVPMIWGEGEYGPNWLENPDNKKYKTILGFNEPDFKDQSNMSVDTAIEEWPSFMESGLRVGSPATGVAAPWSNDWFKPFMEKIDEDSNLDVDFIAVHCYLDGPWADTFLEMIDDCYEKYHKPIWITEFGIAEWNQGKWNTNNPDALRDIAEFMKKVIPALDKREYVERYAWFPFDPTDKYGGASGLYDMNTGKLNSLGKVYRNLGNPKGYTLPNLDGSIDQESIPKDIVVDDGYAELPTDPENPEQETSKAPTVNGKIYTSTTTINGRAGGNANIKLFVEEIIETNNITASEQEIIETDNTTTSEQVTIKINNATTSEQVTIKTEEKEIASTIADKYGNWTAKIPAQKENTIIKVTAKEEGKLESSISVKVSKYSSSSSGSGSKSSSSSSKNSNDKITTGEEINTDIKDTNNMEKNVGWVEDKDNKTWYYFDSISGEKKTGWHRDANTGKWYMLDRKTGAMITGWFNDLNGKWYYLDGSSGEMKTGWYRDVNTGKWYMLDRKSGEMITNWFNDLNGKWYYLDTNSGEMKKGWIVDGNKKWYHLGTSGAMTIGWIKDTDGKWYYMYSDGSMAYDTYIDRYYVNFNGAYKEY